MLALEEEVVEEEELLEDDKEVVEDEDEDGKTPTKEIRLRISAGGRHGAVLEE